MRHGLRCLAFACVLTASASQAFAQDFTGTPGVDVWRPLNPQPPTATVTTVTSPVATRLERQQQMTQEAPVTGRPLGFEVANGRAIPMITAGWFRDSNVFARSTNRLSDSAVFVRPEFLWISNPDPKGQLAAGAFIEAREYNRFHSEDQVNGAAQIGGNYLIDPDTQVVGRAGYTRAHEDRGVSESVFTEFRKPLGYHQFEAAGALNKRFGGWWTSVGASALWLDYDDDAVTLVGIPVSLRYRDGRIVWVPARIGVVVAPNTSIFGELAGNERNWSVDTFDSRGYRAVVGILLEPGQGARVRGEAFAGYMHQDYEGVTFLTISTWTVGAALAFIVAPNVTAVFEARRDAKESALNPFGVLNGGVSLIETLVSGRVDVQVIQNVVIGVGASYLHDAFQGAGRTDRSWSPLASLRWFASRNFTFGLDYRYLDFDSNQTTGYRRNVFMVSGHAKF